MEATGDALELVESRLALRNCPPDAETKEGPPDTDEHDGLEPDQRSSVYFLWYGHRSLKSRRDLETAWKAVRSIASGDGMLSDAERFALVGKMCATGVPPSIVERVMTWDERDEGPADLLASIARTDDARQEMGAWILYEGISAAFADGEIALGEVERLLGVAATLGVANGTVETLLELCCEEVSLRARRIAVLREDVGAAVRSLVEAPTMPPAEHAPPSTATPEAQHAAETTPERALLGPKIPCDLRVTLSWRR